MLGGRPEGIVIKHPAFTKKPGRHNVTPTSAMKCAASQLLVTKEFKEKHTQKKVSADRISPTDYIAWIGAHYNVPARVMKARQHLHTQQNIVDPTIEQLTQELDADLLKERRDEIAAYIWTHFRRYVVSMLANEGQVTGNAIARFNDDPIVIQLRQALSGKTDADAERETVVELLIPNVCAAARQIFSQTMMAKT